MTRRSRFHFRHMALTTLVLLSLLVMAAFPQGTMATRGAQGMEVVLCTGNGPVTIHVDENGKPVEEHHDTAECGWWLLGQGLTLVENPALPVRASFERYVIAPVKDASTGSVRIAFDHTARAPPLV